MTKNVPATIEADENSLTKNESNLPALSPDLMEAFGGIQGTGFENVRRKDIIIPRLTILQGLSPQVTKGEAKYNDKARVGQIYDVALDQIFEDEVHVLPLHFIVQWLEWAPRKSGKGLQGIHEVQPDPKTYTVDEKGKWIKPNGNIIAETAQFFCLNLSAAGRPCFIPFSSSQLKKSRQWMTYATNEVINVNGMEQTPPLFYRSYLLTTVPERNAEGNWMGWSIKPDKRVDELANFRSRLNAVNEFRKQILAGEVRADLVEEDEIGSGGSSNSDDRRM